MTQNTWLEFRGMLSMKKIIIFCPKILEIEISKLRKIAQCPNEDILINLNEETDRQTDRQETDRQIEKRQTGI